MVQIGELKLIFFILSIVLILVTFIMSILYSVYKEVVKIIKEKPIEQFYLDNSFKPSYVNIDHISTNLKMIILGTEDNRFFSHRGIDYSQIIYALYKNIRSGRKKMGGSTITQQLAKNVYLSFAKTYRRKLVEFFLAYYIESKLSKEQIFELYLNIIYYGKDQFGISAASEYWFKKLPLNISINEALTLAALLPAPTKYNPLSEYDLFPKAKKLALKKLKKHNLIDSELEYLLLQQNYNTVVDADIVRKFENIYNNEYHKRANKKGNNSEMILINSRTLVNHVRACSKMPTVYLWGGLGEIITEDVIQDRRKVYPKRYDEAYCEHLKQYIGKGVRGFDCSGLIKNCLMGGISDYVYDENVDWNSCGLLERATQKGPISTLPEIEGVCLHMPGHVGVYIGNGYVVEATNNPKFGDGVVTTRLDDRQWVSWFCCPGVNYKD